MFREIKFCVLITAVIACFCLAESIVTVKTTKEDALYSLSQKAVFAVAAAQSLDFDYTLTRDGKDLRGSGKMTAGQEPVMIEGSLDEPGFLRCTVKYVNPQSGAVEYAVAAAGFEPEKIKPGFSDVPDDFDAFWSERRAQLACIPMEPVMQSVTSADPDVEVFDVQAACIGMPISGYYARPVNTAKGKCPAILFVHGAGVTSARTGNVTKYADLGFIALEINAHGIPNGKDAAYYEGLAKGKLLNYRYFGRENQYTSYFTGMFTRVMRALEFLKSQPQWDGKVLIAYGSSQGGAQALAAAGLDEDVNMILTGVPAMCDHSGVINGWPLMVPLEADGSFNKQISDASRYIDCVNFARKSKAYGLFTVGFIDNVCRPTSVYAAYNSFAGRKEIINEPLMAHAFPPSHGDAAMAKILEFVAAAKD